MIAGAGGNIAASVGGDGVIMVDSGRGPATDRILTAIGDIAR